MPEPVIDVPLVDLRAQRARLGGRVEEAVTAVLDHGRFVLGPEVSQLEEALARRGGVRHAVACSSGTDALLLALLAWGVQPGDAVFVPAFTFAATAEVVVLAGATPVFVDVGAATFNVDVDSLTAAIDWAATAGLRPAGVITVDLFGHPADYPGLRAAAADRGLWLLADAAQSVGATLGGRPVGSLADVTATSFFPTKPLGCYGDGGALFTDDDDLARRFRSLREHGRGDDKYENVAVGTNARLDTLQAAILLVKLQVFDDEVARRREVAARYTDTLCEAVEVPRVMTCVDPAWACYTVRAPDRDRLRRDLRGAGIASAVYYPRGLHQQPAYRCFPTAPAGLPVSERLAAEVVSLPMHPYLDRTSQDRVIDAVLAGG